ncbi:MAG: hypothetical protein ACPK7O_03095 [Methanobacterium sp.]
MDALLYLYVLSFVSSLISAILALYAILFSKRTENRLKNNFKHIKSMMDTQNEKTEVLLNGMREEAEDIRGSVQVTRLELLDSIESVYRIREEILESMQSLEDSCIIKEDDEK